MTDYKLEPKSIVDELAQFIRHVDGNNKMGAGSLADKICERFHVTASAVQVEPLRHPATPSFLEYPSFDESANFDPVPAVLTAPDVTGLVEALQAISRNELDAQRAQHVAAVALAAYCKQQEPSHDN